MPGGRVEFRVACPEHESSAPRSRVGVAYQLRVSCAFALLLRMSAVPASEIRSFQQVFPLSLLLR